MFDETLIEGRRRPVINGRTCIHHTQRFTDPEMHSNTVPCLLSWCISRAADLESNAAEQRRVDVLWSFV
jgi:hypothetical protein